MYMIGLCEPMGKVSGLDWTGLDWTVGPLDYWTIFWTIFLDHFCTDVLDLFYSGRSERLTIKAKGGVIGGYISKYYCLIEYLPDHTNYFERFFE